MRSCLLPVILSVLLLMDGCSVENGADKSICNIQTFPQDGDAVHENDTIILSWDYPGLHTYEIYLGVGSAEPTRIAGGLTERNYTYIVPPGDDITYNWYVRPTDANGAHDQCASTPHTFTAQSLPDKDEQKIVNVLVLNYDPEMKIIAPGLKLHEFLSWSDPHVLAQEYIHDILVSSDSVIKYNIAEWKDLDEFPIKADGFRYNDSTYFICKFTAAGANCHTPDDMGYYQIFEEHKIEDGINQGKYEEVWIFGGPYFGFWESAMAGTNVFYINGDMFNQAKTTKSFVIMGFSYERGVAEMLHNLCHRTEATMSIVSNGWRAEELTTPWSRFAANGLQSGGEAGVGSCHFPANARSEYDYVNGNAVYSSADDWLKYPLLTHKKKLVSSASWGPPDYHRSYMNWWFSHLPRRKGVGPDGRLNCWWRYVFDFNETILHQ